MIAEASTMLGDVNVQFHPDHIDIQTLDDGATGSWTSVGTCVVLETGKSLSKLKHGIEETSKCVERRLRARTARWREDTSADLYLAGLSNGRACTVLDASQRQQAERGQQSSHAKTGFWLLSSVQEGASAGTRYHDRACREPDTRQLGFPWITSPSSRGSRSDSLNSVWLIVAGSTRPIVNLKQILRSPSRQAGDIMRCFKDVKRWHM
jgi:hypothetical protein